MSTPRRPLNYPWLRLYSEVLNNPKAQQLPGEVYKGWINLLALANTGEPRGALPAQEAIAFKLRMTTDTVGDLLRDLERRGFLDRDADGKLWPHDWHVWQADSDVSTERVRKHRELKAATEGEPRWKAEAFDRTFAAFPRQKRTGKADAFAQFCESVRDPADVKVLEETLRSYLNDHRAPDAARFVMAPARFFGEWRGMAQTPSDRERERAEALRKAL